MKPLIRGLQESGVLTFGPLRVLKLPLIMSRKKVYTVHYFCESTAMLKFFGISAQNEA